MPALLPATDTFVLWRASDSVGIRPCHIRYLPSFPSGQGRSTPRFPANVWARVTIWGVHRREWAEVRSWRCSCSASGFPDDDGSRIERILPDFIVGDTCNFNIFPFSEELQQVVIVVVGRGVPLAQQIQEGMFVELRYHLQMDHGGQAVKVLRDCFEKPGR